jgi:hypothetical protein
MMNNNTKTGILAGLVVAFVALGLIAGVSALEAWLLKVLWNWVVVDTLALSAAKLPFFPAWFAVIVLNVFLAKFKTNVAVKK